MVELICPSCKQTQTDGNPLCPRCVVNLVPREQAAEEPAPAPPAPAAAASAPAAAERAAAVPVLRFPWGDERLPAGGRLLVGREKSPLAERLAAYTNVGRRHAELRLLGDRLVVIDLDSKNGTWVNEERMAPMSPRELGEGDVVRFAAGLRLTVVPGGAA